MGYTTDFEGTCQFDTPLTPDQVAFIQKFSSTRRMKRDEASVARRADPLREAVGLPVGTEGEYYVGADRYDCGFNDKSVLNGNYPPETQPGLWCNWTVSDDGTEFKWNEGEKFYSYIEWLEYMIAHFFEPWGKKMSGNITWQGEDEEDTGTIIVDDNQITIDGDEIGYRNQSVMRKAMLKMFSTH